MTARGTGCIMVHLMTNRVALVLVSVALLCGAALTRTQAEDKPAARKVPTSHYVDFTKQVEFDVPVVWERKWPEQDDERVRFMFSTGGKSGPNAQPPEFLMVTAGPDANDASLKSLAAYVEAVKKQAAAGADHVKLDADKESTVDGAKAVSFGGTRTMKAGPARFVYVVTLHNGIGYAMSFACDPATFEAEYAGAKAVFESIKWSKQGQ